MHWAQMVTRLSPIHKSSFIKGRSKFSASRFKGTSFRLGNVHINKNFAVAAPLLMKEKWSMSSSWITESLNIFISRFRCWGNWPQITEQPLMSLCPYLFSLLTACYLQFHIPLGDTKWMHQQCKGWKTQKLIKSTGEPGKSEDTCWLFIGVLGGGWEGGSGAVWYEIWLIKSPCPLVSVLSTLCKLWTWKE